ncbi:VWA domain-containing protein [Streptomyces macrosporus]|uniref:vWA found in TerF C terminus domain-containing protein n=1 Tax=Streptomyces macrosporus TaxID=44032 RepID=A0ABP5XIV3_9ACTN
MDLIKVETQVPALLGPARQAGQALARAGAAGRRAAVYLILDHGWIMEELYESFAVQAFTERVLAPSANLDDDGTVPVVFSSGDEPLLEEIRLDNDRGRGGRLHTQSDWGSDDVAAAMRAAVHHYQQSGASDARLQAVVAEGRQEQYSRDGGRRAPGLIVEFTDIDYVEPDFRPCRGRPGSARMGPAPLHRHPVGVAAAGPGFGSGMTCRRRLRGWNNADVWQRLHGTLRAAGRPGLSRAVIDRSHVRALKGGPRPIGVRSPGAGRAASTT